MVSLYNENPKSTGAAAELVGLQLIDKLKELDAKAQRNGLSAFEPAKNMLDRIGTEVDGSGTVTKNSYGLFNLSWQSEKHPEWPALIQSELTEIKKRIRETHGVGLKYLIWAGMGGSAEDKSLYNAAGLLRKGPRVYVLDSTDPAKLKNILADMQVRSGKSLAETLKSTLVIGMALGMTSYEPVVNLRKLSMLFALNKVDSRVNFVYMTLPDSLLDQFGREQGYCKVEMQLDGGNGTSGRHSAPLTRGSLYPLGLAGVDLGDWMRATELTPEELDEALRLSAFLRTQCRAGRDKVTLLLPKIWAGAGVWTKQNFEESLGKSEEFGIKIVIGEPIKLASYHSPKNGVQDRCFLAVQIKGQPQAGAAKIAALRRAGYPVAVVTLRAPELSRYMQFIHYTVFGIGYQEGMNFITQPSVELYKAITNKLFTQCEDRGGIEKTDEWLAMQSTSKRLRFRGGITVYFDRLPDALAPTSKSAAGAYAEVLGSLASDRRVEYGELTYFGDSRYGASGKALRKALDKAGDAVFRATLRMPVDVYEGPAMNHSYHEMVIGHGRCLSTVLLSEKPEKFAEAEYTADYHRAQFLATQMALAERNRYVVAITLKDLEEPTLWALAAFFREVAQLLKSSVRR